MQSSFDFKFLKCLDWGEWEALKNKCVFVVKEKIKRIK